MRYENEGYKESGLPWLAEEVWRETLLPGGVKLDAAAFPTGVESGSLIGRSRAEAEAGTGFGPAADADDEIYLLMYDVPKPAENNDADVVRHTTLIRYNYLETYAAMSAGLKAKLHQFYHTTLGTEEGKPS